MLRSRWGASPDANVILPTGRVFDVFDVPAIAGMTALVRMEVAGVPVGPVATYASERYLFFVATRGAPPDEDEWWSCHLDVTKSHTGELGTCGLDAVPDSLERDIRWHCRDSYVVAPPSVLPAGGQVSWVRHPGDRPLPDPLALLEPLAEACDEPASY